MTGTLAAGLVAFAVDQQQLPEDVGKAGPVGLALIVALLIATLLLVRSMGRHLRKVPRSFDPDDARFDVPDTPAELLDPPGSGAGPADPPGPGQELLDTLRRAPRAIEPPRSSGPDGPRDGSAGR